MGKNTAPIVIAIVARFAIVRLLRLIVKYMALYNCALYNLEVEAWKGH